MTTTHTSLPTCDWEHCDGHLGKFQSCRDEALFELSLDGFYDSTGDVEFEGHFTLIALDAPKTKLLAQKLKGMGLDSVLVITDNLDENLLLASRNLPNVLVVEPRHADPVSLVFYKKVLITKPALAKIEEMLA